jgi:hypothetical protein
MPNQSDIREYRISPASRDDMNEGWVWVRWPEKDEGLRKKIEGRRRIVKIKKIKREAGDAKESEPVYCEALYADPLFVERYNDYCKQHQSSDQGTGSATMPPEGEGCQASEVTGNNSKSEDAESRIFISAWYRYLLGIQKAEEAKIDPRRSLEITIPEDLWQALYWQFLACVRHPQIVVALGTVLGLMGFFLGIGGFGLGLTGLKDLVHWGRFTVYIGRFGVVLALLSVVTMVIGAVIPFYLRAKRGIVSKESDE